MIKYKDKERENPSPRGLLKDWIIYRIHPPDSFVRKHLRVFTNNTGEWEVFNVAQRITAISGQREERLAVVLWAS
jgi:hypothetical protein